MKINFTAIVVYGSTNRDGLNIYLPKDLSRAMSVIGTMSERNLKYYPTDYYVENFRRQGAPNTT